MFYLKKARPKPEIQLAPLIDMVFLLLIFFMVATVFPDKRGIQVEKPPARTAGKLPNKNLVFNITRTGEIIVAGKKITMADVGAIVGSTMKKNPGTTVIVNADRNAITGDLVKLLDEARKGGAENLAIGAEEAENPE